MNSTIEKEVINLFICRRKRERAMMFAKSQNSRPKFLRELNGPGVFVQDRMREFEGADRQFRSLIQIYRNLGMKDSVYVISENEDWDGQVMDLHSILQQANSRCMDTLGYCQESKTAFYEWHHGGSFLLGPV